MLHLIQLAGEEVIGSGNDHQLRRRRGTGDGRFHFGLRAIFILASTDKQLRLDAMGEKVVVVRPSTGAYWQPQRGHPLYPRIAATGTQADTRAKGKAGEEQRQFIFPLQPIERGLHIVHFAMPVRVFAFAQARTAKIKPQHRQPIRLKGLHGVVHHLVVHGAAKERMRMANQRRIRSVLTPLVQ